MRYAYTSKCDNGKHDDQEESPQLDPRIYRFTDVPNTTHHTRQIN